MYDSKERTVALTL